MRTAKLALGFTLSALFTLTLTARAEDKPAAGKDTSSSTSQGGDKGGKGSHKKPKAGTAKKDQPETC